MIFRRTAKFLYLLFTGHAVRTSYFLSNWIGGGNASLSSDFVVTANSITHRPTNRKISLDFAQIFGRNLPLLQKYFIDFEMFEEEAKLIISCQCNKQPISISIETPIDLSIHKEIFQEDTYGLRLCSQAIIIDIGMNIGMASLYFASMSCITRVYGFELIPNTYEKAVFNFSLNPFLKSKITSFGFGLGDKNGFIDEQSIEGVSVFSSANNASFVRKSKIEVKRADQILSEIFAQHPNDRFILKVDCEGAEYGILEAIANGGLMDRIDGFIIEWHDQGPGLLTETLIKNKFNCYHYRNPHYPEKLGMISAWSC